MEDASGDGKPENAAGKVLTVQAAWAGDALILHLEGELDLATVVQVREPLAAALDAGTRHVAIDMIGCTFIDSTGLGALLHAAKRLEENGGQMAMVCVDSQVRRLLGLTMIDRTIPIFESVPGALAHLGGTATVS